MDFAKQVVLWAFVIYAVLVVCMFTFQRQLQYFPDTRRVTPEQAGISGVDEVEIQTSDSEKLVAWFSAARDGKPTIIYFHGNGGALWYRAERLAAFRADGYGVLLAGYRGYGGSTGTPTETGLIRDARAAVEFLTARGVSTDSMVFYGESLGTGVAVQLAVEITPGALVLESPFTAAVDVASGTYWWLPVTFLMKDKFQSKPLIDKIGIPLLIVHGEEDRVIPIAQGKDLFAAANEPKQLIVVPDVGHNMPLSSSLLGQIQVFIAGSIKAQTGS